MQLNSSEVEAWLLEHWEETSRTLNYYFPQKWQHRSGYKYQITLQSIKSRICPES